MGSSKRPSRTIPVSREVAQARAGIAKHRSILRGLAVYKARAPLEQLNRTLPHLLRLPAYKPHIWPNPFPESHSKANRNGLPTYADLPHELIWASQSLLLHSKEIARFLELKRAYDQSILLGEHDVALSSINAVQSELGVSLWHTESSINFLEVTEGFEAQKEFASELINNEDAPGLARFVATWQSFRAEKNVSALAFLRQFSSAIELDNGTLHLIHIALGLCPSVSIDHAALMVSLSDNLSVVDRYLWLLLTVQALLASGDVGAAELSLIGEILHPLATAIKDPTLLRLVVACGGPDHLSSTPLIDALDRYTENEPVPLSMQSGSIDALHLALRVSAWKGESQEFDQAQPNSLIDLIRSDLDKIVRCSPEAVEAATRLEKLALVHASSPWAASLSLVLERQITDERVNAATRTQIFHALRSQDDNPILCFSLDALGTGDHYLDSYFPGDASPTVRVMKAVRSPTAHAEWNSVGLAPERQARMRALGLLRHGDAAGAVSLLSDHISDASTDAASFAVGLLLAHAANRADDVALCANISVSLFLRSRYFGSVLPIKPLVEKLLERAPQLGHDVSTRISAAIVFDIYSRFISNDRDPERADAFKDVLYAAGVRTSSSIYRAVPGLAPELLTYFLRYVCVPNVLDQSLVLSTTRAVEDERTEILIVLAEIASSQEIILPAEDLEELRAIKTRQVIRDTTLRVDQSKVYVNIDGIKTSIMVDIKENWQRYRLLRSQRDMNTQLDDLEKLIHERTGHRTTLISLNLPVNERSKLFVRMVQQVRDLFSLSKEYGLDANLSTNIRHGYVMRELRAPFVAARLVTNKDTDAGEYQSNVHWTSGVDFRTEYCAKDIQRYLSEFSRSVDETISYLNNELLRIKSEAKPEGVFDFTIDDATFGLLQRGCEEIETAEEFFDLIVDFLWKITEISLNDVHAALHDRVLPELNEAINVLDRSLDELSEPESVGHIRQALHLLRPDIQSAVERVRSWFSLSGNAEYVDYDIKVAHDAGLATVRSYYPQMVISSVFESSIVMSGFTLPFMVRMFFILLDNAVSHCGSNSKVDIEGCATASVGRVVHIQLSNSLAPTLDLEDVRCRMAQVSDAYGREGASEFVPREGGSGFPKIWKILTHDLRRENTACLSLNAGRANIEIMFDGQGLAL